MLVLISRLKLFPLCYKYKIHERSENERCLRFLFLGLIPQRQHSCRQPRSMSIELRDASNSYNSGSQHTGTSDSAQRGRNIIRDDVVEGHPRVQGNNSTKKPVQGLASIRHKHRERRGDSQKKSTEVVGLVQRLWSIRCWEETNKTFIWEWKKKKSRHKN